MLLTKREVKTAGYSPSSPRLRLGPEKLKQELGKYLAILTEQGRSIKHLLDGQKITPKNFALAGTN